MPDPNMPDDDQNDDTSEILDPNIRAEIRELRRRNRELSESAGRATAMERELAFTRALGSDADGKRMSYFIKAYDGEISPEAIRAAAEEAGFLAPSGAPEPRPDLESFDRLNRATSGATTSRGEPNWGQELAEADRITDPDARTAAILTVVEKHGGQTNRTMQ